MTFWNDIIAGICLLLLVLLMWKEFQRANRSRLAARVIASVLAVVGLSCLALPLSYKRGNDSPAFGREGILLTEGYDPDSLREFLQAGGTGAFSRRDMKVFRAIDGFPVGLVSFAGRGGLEKLHVFGYGLTRKEWASLHPSPLIFHPSVAGTGIVSVSWKQKLLAGEKLRVQGSLTPAARGPVKLILTGMGLPLDSVIIAAGIPTAPGSREKGPIAGAMPKQTTIPVQTDFELNTIPAQSGRSVYRLLVVDSFIHSGIGGRNAADTLEQELLPVEVLPGKKLKILLLAVSPDFENTFLANWLSRNGHAVATRTRISKDKYDKAFLNMPETALDLLTPFILDKFDIVIADAAVLQSGSSIELSNLRRQIAEKGMGLIVKADSSSGPGGYPFEAVKDSAHRLYIKERPGIQALLRDSLSRTVVSGGISGSGKLVFTTLNTTYSRMLSGEKKEYAAYWSSILQKVVRETESGDEWQFAPALPRINEPVEAQLRTNKDGLPQGQLDNTALYLGQDPLLPFLWGGTYWPVEAGWQSCATLQGDTCWWYVWPARGWRNVSRSQRRQETEEYIADQAPATVSPMEKPGDDGGRVFIPKAWFYALFLLSCLFLWVERKV